MIPTLQQAALGRYIMESVAAAVTFNPSLSNRGTDATLSGGNLTATFLSTGGNGTNAETTTAYSSGKHYAEFLINSIDGLNHEPCIGMWKQGGTSGNQAGPGQNVGTGSGWFINQGGTIGNKGSFITSVTGFSVSDIIQVAADIGTLEIWIGKNNVWYFGGNPSAGTGGTAFLDSSILYCAAACGPGGVSNSVTGKFSLASFTYTPPTGFLPW